MDGNEEKRITVKKKLNVKTVNQASVRINDKKNT